MGSTDSSYALQTARLAGLPQAVIGRAQVSNDHILNYTNHNHHYITSVSNSFASIAKEASI